MIKLLSILDTEGFSLVEVIAVLAILVIVTALIVSRSDTKAEDIVLQAETFKNQVRSVQAMALAGSGQADLFGVKWDNAFYWAFRGTDPNSNIIRLFDDERYNVNKDNKLSLAEKKISIVSALHTVFFDDRGIPYSAYTDKNNNTPFSSDLQIVITPYGSSSPSKSISITQHTGFVP
jgi:prepilin-type N-terminal cleavage/methylation domain-containing protein